MAQITKSRRHRGLSNNQEIILKLLLKFRFVNIKQLSIHSSKGYTSVVRSLNKLVRIGYVEKRYYSSYRLRGRGAEYYLKKKGLDYLSQTININKKLYNSYVRNYKVSEELISKSLLIFNEYIKLIKNNNENLNIATKAEFIDQEVFPSPLPDLYIYSDDKKYFLDIFTQNLFFYIRDRIKQYISHYESDDWPEEKYPSLIFIVPNKRLLNKANKFIEVQLENHFLDNEDLDFKLLIDNTLLASN